MSVACVVASLAARLLPIPLVILAAARRACTVIDANIYPEVDAVLKHAGLRLERWFGAKAI